MNAWLTHAELSVLLVVVVAIAAAAALVALIVALHLAGQRAQRLHERRRCASCLKRHQLGADWD